MYISSVIALLFALALAHPAKVQQNGKDVGYKNTVNPVSVKKEREASFIEMKELVKVAYYYDYSRKYRVEYVFNHPQPICPESIKKIAINLACPAGDPSITRPGPPQKTGRDLSRPSAKFY